MRIMKGEYQTGLRTLWEIDEILNGVESRANRDPAQWMVHKDDGRTKSPTRAAVLSALVLYLDGLPAAEQAAAIRSGMARLNALVLDESQARPLFGPAITDTPSKAQKKSRRA